MILYLGLFALVEHGVTRYNVLQSIRSLLLQLKPSSPSHLYTHFTTLKPYTAHQNSALCHVDPGTLLELCQQPITSSSSITSFRLRTLFASLPHSLNKHRSSSQQSKSFIKKRLSTNDHVDVKSNLHDEILTFRSDSVGLFVPVYTQLPSTASFDPSSYLSNPIQGLYSTNFLSKLTRQYPLIVELIISRWLDEHGPTTTPGYPFRRLTVHRLVDDHRRMIAFDMHNNTFVEIDFKHAINMSLIKPTSKRSQHYQRQLRWCHKHLSLFRSQVKTILRSANDTTMFIQTTHAHKSRSSTAKSKSKPAYASQDSVCTTSLPAHESVLAKFYTISNDLKYDQAQRHREMPRKNVRVHFNESTIERYSRTKHSSLTKKCANQRGILPKREKANGDEDKDELFQCTAL